MLIARIIRSVTRFRRLQPQGGRVHAVVLRLSRGRIRRSVVLAGGQPVLVLTTTGRRSGRRRSTVVAYLRYGDAYAVEALNLGSDRQPAWYLNLRADPRAWVEVNGERRAVRAREAAGEEAEELWSAYIRRQPMVGNFRRLSARDIPMMVLEPDPGATSAPAGPRA